MTDLLFPLAPEKTPEWYEQQLGLYRLALSAAEERIQQTLDLIYDPRHAARMLTRKEIARSLKART